jgi:hypothetical protein
MKRITIPVQGNIDAIRKQLQEQLGVDLSYSQVIDFLIKHYRDSVKPQSTWRSA